MTDSSRLPGAFKRELEAKFEGYSWDKVKASVKRSVYHLTKQGYPGVYLKVFHPGDLFQRIRNLISPRTQKEADMLKELADSGIPVAEVLAHFCHGASSAIAVKEVENSRPLICFEKDFQEKILFSVTSDLLEHGFVHDDLHPGNILIDNKDHYIMIDCYEVKKKNSIRLSDRINSFAMTASVFGTSRSVIKTFLPDYDQRTISTIESSANNIRRRRIKRRIKRSLSDGSFSRIEKNGDYHAIVRRDETLELEEIINIHRNNIRTGSNLLKVQEKTQVSVVGAYCVKNYKKSPMLLKPYALRAWKGSLILRFNGLRVAEPAACIIFKDKSSMLISKKLEYPQLDRLLNSGRLNAQENKNLAVSIGLTIGRMHLSGIFHADLKACNIFIDTDMNEALFIDTDRVTQLRHISREKRMRNLMQIGLSIPRAVAISAGRAMIDAYATQTGDSAEALFNEMKLKMKGKEIVYTTDEGDRFEVC